MRRTQGRSIRHAARRWTVWLLLWSLAVHGYAGVVQQLLGSSHRHEAIGRVAPVRSAHDRAGTPDAHGDGWFQALRAWRQSLHARGHAMGFASHGHGHHHDAFERHHHDVADATVVALGDRGAAAEGLSDAGAAAVSGAAAQPLAGACGLRLPAVAATSWAWPAARERAWRSAFSKRLDRPPRA